MAGSFPISSFGGGGDGGDTPPPSGGSFTITCNGVKKVYIFELPSGIEAKNIKGSINVSNDLSGNYPYFPQPYTDIISYPDATHVQIDLTNLPTDNGLVYIYNY